ncbi:hypothetical protein GCM10027566_05100 [Arachidicoccus ginsenosidivorans]
MAIKNRNKIQPIDQNNKETARSPAVPQKKTFRSVFTHRLRSRLVNITLIVITAVLLFSGDAKTWLLQKLMLTGLFNARIDQATGQAFSKSPTKSDASYYDASDFTFQNENGQKTQLSELRGKVVFINIWATWCPPCRAELPSIAKLYLEFKDNPEVFFLLLNEDDIMDYQSGNVQAFLKKSGYTLPVYRLITTPPIFYKGTLPTTIVLDKKGRIRFKKEGAHNFSGDEFINDMAALIRE